MSLRVRASKADLLFECGAAGALEDGGGNEIVRVDHDHDGARIGRAAHEAIASILREEHPQTAEVCRNHGVERHLEDVEFLVQQALRMWGRLRDQFGPSPMIEQTLLYEDAWITASGTADVGSILCDTIRVVDWKSAYRGNYYHQLRMLAWLATHWTECIWVELYVGWLRHGEMTCERFHVDELARWWKMWMDVVGNKVRERTYSPGDHCGRCGRRHSCPGRRAYIDNVIAEVRYDGDFEIDLAAGQRIAEQLRTLSQIGEFTDEYRNRLREWMKEHGSIAIGDGQELRLVGGTKKEIEPRSAWPIIWESVGRSNAAMARVVSFGLTALKEEVFRRHPRGRKGAEWNAILKKLSECGALTIVEQSPQIRACRAKETVDDGHDSGSGTGDGEGAADGRGAHREDGESVAPRRDA